MHCVSDSCWHCEQVNATLTNFVIEPQNPPIGAEGQAALAALQVRQPQAFRSDVVVVGLQFDIPGGYVELAGCGGVGRSMWA